MQPVPSPVVLHNPPTVNLSGRMCGGRYVPKVWRTDAPLAAAEYELLLELALARLKEPDLGYTPLPNPADLERLHQYTRRLRRALDRALAPGDGKALVVHAGRSRYYLAVSALDITPQPSLPQVAGDFRHGLIDEIFAAYLACQPAVISVSAARG